MGLLDGVMNVFKLKDDDDYDDDFDYGVWYCSGVPYCNIYSKSNY